MIFLVVLLSHRSFVHYMFCLSMFCRYPGGNLGSLLYGDVSVMYSLMEIKVSMFNKTPLKSHRRINVIHDFFSRSKHECIIEIILTSL